MSTKILKVNRGDSLDFVVDLHIKNEYLLSKNDAVYFALMYPHQRFEDAILIKGYTCEDQNIDTGEINIKITPNDTRNLTPGIYYYTIKLKRGGNLIDLSEYDEPEEIKTIIERTKFIINE